MEQKLKEAVLAKCLELCPKQMTSVQVNGNVELFHSFVIIAYKPTFEEIDGFILREKNRYNGYYETLKVLIGDAIPSDSHNWGIAAKLLGIEDVDADDDDEVRKDPELNFDDLGALIYSRKSQAVIELLEARGCKTASEANAIIEPYLMLHLEVSQSWGFQFCLALHDASTVAQEVHKHFDVGNSPCPFPMYELGISF